MTAPSLRDRYEGALLALACGDAIGTTVEFSPRGSFSPVRGMIGGGPFSLKPGQWTDDTSMALCLAESLIEKGGFDASDQMERYLKWWHCGYLSSTGECFDIGVTTRAALSRFETTREPFSGSTEPSHAGNGSLMRLAPVVLRFFPDRQHVQQHAAASSRTTHGAAEAVDCCRLLAAVLCNALAGLPKERLLEEAASTLTEPKSARPVASLEQQVLGGPFAATVLRYGKLYGPGTGFDASSPGGPVHVNAAAEAAHLSIMSGQSGIFNIAEEDGTISSAKAKFVLGWNPAFRITNGG